MNQKFNIDKARNYFGNELWRNKEDERRPQVILKKVLRILIVSVREFITDGTSSRASALTYSTLLSIVPILAILFAISRGFGFNEMMENEIYSTFSNQREVADYLMKFVDSYLVQSKSGIFLGVGIVLLLVTVLNLISSIETTFNAIWEVKKARTLYRKITDYFSLFLLLPVFIVVSSGLSIYIGAVVKGMHDYIILGSMMKFLIRLIPFAMSWLMFTGLYVFMPNTKVHFVPALIAGIAAGTGYQFFQFLYINGQFSLSKYNAIYGSFAALPLFLLWLQISWTIILFGVQLNYALQNAKNFSYIEDASRITRRYTDFACIIVMSMICKRFCKGEKPYTPEMISTESKMPIRLTHQTLHLLQEINLIHEVEETSKSSDDYFLPSVDVHSLTVKELLHRIYTYGSENFNIDHEKQFRSEWKALLEEHDRMSSKKDRLLIDL